MKLVQFSLAKQKRYTNPVLHFYSIKLNFRSFWNTLHSNPKLNSSNILTKSKLKVIYHELFCWEKNTISRSATQFPLRLFLEPGTLVMIYNMKLLDSGETELEVGITAYKYMRLMTAQLVLKFIVFTVNILMYFSVAVRWWYCDARIVRGPCWW